MLWKKPFDLCRQKPLGTQGKRKMTTPTAPKNQNEVVLIQKHRNLRHPQGFLGGRGCEVGSLLSEKIR
ncbi:hypothetical protein F3D69_24330 [Bacteroides ovatus]|uniref:Uncharacterized protein n=1 Tax=Bacteroides ovatus TaxID=28116 RepID=A0A5M5E7R7_BACOV|nr:hypothetical protein F3D64_30595 [Bacteroides ovatus]KAA4004319.1 hypothetical protein F3F37_23650 [Bacteroides ovatus]KAA4014740.1 hypothetical protein F3D53_28105 [Bacteroides ovatus]KAA4027600.1 hypothetical protein F3D52_18080 [Bacteroides ovatus]KAA4032739.1 hypothetical protein F3D60_09735 [Bacteroides ovatus]